MKRVALSELKDDLSRFLRLAEGEEIVITRHGKPAGVLIGFKSDERVFGRGRVSRSIAFQKRSAQRLAEAGMRRRSSKQPRVAWPFARVIAPTP